MKIIFKNNNSEELILLFNGWGMDERPYKPLKCNRDILFVSDYSDLTFELPQNFAQKFGFSKYKKIILITFSAGAFMASFLKNKLPKLDLKIALSGNFHLFKEGFGVPEDILFEMKNLTFENALEFRKKLVDEKREYDLFNKNQPLRSLESSQNELSALEKYSEENSNPDFKFDKVIIGKNDKIIPYKNQLKAWDNHKNLKTLEGGHFLFYKFEDFDDIINF